MPRSLVEKAVRKYRRETRKTVHKRQLVAEIARHTSLTRDQVAEALQGTLEVIADKMAAGECVTLVGFGCFRADEHRGREVRGLDGRIYRVDSRRVPSFHPYPALRRRVQEQATNKERKDGQDATH